MVEKDEDDKIPGIEEMKKFSEEESRDMRRCNIEVPRWLRDQIRAAAKRSGRTMISYLEWTIPDEWGKTRVDYEREDEKYEEEMRLIRDNYIQGRHSENLALLTKGKKESYI